MAIFAIRREPIGRELTAMVLIGVAVWPATLRGGEGGDAKADANSGAASRNELASPSPPASRPAAQSTTRPAEADASRVAELIAQLASEKFALRERAHEALRQIGVSAVPALRAAATDKDAERSQRAQTLLKDMALRIDSWRTRWEGMTLTLRLQSPADPAKAFELSIDANGWAAAALWDPERKAPGRYESQLPRDHLDQMVRALSRLQPWNLDKASPWPAPDGNGSLSLLVTVGGEFAAIDQPWPQPRGVGLATQDKVLISELAGVQAEVATLAEVVRRDATIREQSRRRSAEATSLPASSPPRPPR